MTTRRMGFILVMLAMPAFSLITGSLGLVGITGCAGAAPTDVISTFPQTCLEVQEAAVDETGDRPANGTYTLYIDGDESQPWDVYCHNMNQSEPAEYLSINEADNYSQIRNEDAMAETTYRRYRIDPIQLEINPLDTTFATNGFDDFTPTLPEGLDAIPAGWAEVQVALFNAGTPALANADLTDTPFVFSETILDNNLMDFFCQVDSDSNTTPYTTGTGAEVGADLKTFHLTAVNTNSPSMGAVSTREVADCANLGTGATDFTSGAWPLTYVP